MLPGQASAFGATGEILVTEEIIVTREMASAGFQALSSCDGGPLVPACSLSFDDLAAVYKAMRLLEIQHVEELSLDK